MLVGKQSSERVVYGLKLTIGLDVRIYRPIAIAGSLGSILLALVVCPSYASAQGVASRGVRPTPRGQPSGIPFRARFVDVAREAGLLRPTVYGEVDYKDYILETIGGGAAWLDYDKDGWIDLLIMGGTRFGNPTSDSSLQLHRNLGNGTFEEVTRAAGLHRVGWASSATVGDFDNDGHQDIFVTFWGQNVLYRNLGDASFVDTTGEAGLLDSERRWGAGSTFLDYDRDGFLDLFVTNYLHFDPETTPGKGSGTNCTWKGVPVNCGPRGLPQGRHNLYRNLGDGVFQDVTEESGIGDSAPGYGMTAVAADLDGDGWVDLYVACDGTPSLLFRNLGDGTFREEGLERGVALSEDAIEQAGMGVGIGDYDLDGDLDLFKTHFSDDTNVLYRNDGGGVFDDRTVEAGLGVETRFVGWGAAIADLDNDGWPDLAYVTGSVYPEVEEKLPHYPYKTSNVVFRNLGAGRFEELIEGAGPGMAAAHSSRGAAFGDYDNDGDIDMLVVNMNEPPSLLRNDLSGTAGWLQLMLRGAPSRSNRAAIGAQVVLRYGSHVQARAVTAQSSFYSVDDPRLHFGLGSAKRADVTIRWPSGTEERLEGLLAGRMYIVEEGKGIVR
ncbi:MAG: CRTAC1 family protein [Bryobacterales bacterium]|nr:CRTAC1 family protein [Bryobacterales bacterium]